jgi:hypothetical protein
MSNPIVSSISPSNGETDIVLGTSITVVFDQAIDPTTVNSTTVVVYGPGSTGLIGPDQLLQNDPKIVSGREIIPGKFTFPAANRFVFTAATPFKPNTKYTLLLAGASSLIVKNSIKNPAGTPLAKSVQTVFTTGVIDQTAVPPASPLPWDDPLVQPWERATIDPDSVSISPELPQGNDLTQQIVLTFPAPIDPGSFNPADILCAVEPLSNDPLIRVPANLQYTVQVTGNQIIITIGNWPTPPPGALPFPNQIADAGGLAPYAVIPY